MNDEILDRLINEAGPIHASWADWHVAVDALLLDIVQAARADGFSWEAISAALDIEPMELREFYG